MTIKHLGGVFGRNPTFYNVTIEGELIFEGGIDINSDLTVDGVTTVRVNSDGATAEAFNVLNNGTGNNTQVRVYFGAGEYNTVGRGLRIDAGRDSGADGIATFYSVDQAEHSDYEAIKILTDGGVTLSHLGNNKLATSSTGITVTGTVTETSDRNEKQDIEALSDAEQRVAVAAKGLLRKFRWRADVEERGDSAEIHFGIIAQDLQSAFEAEGLDANQYGVVSSTTWTDEETGEEHSRLGVHYSGLLAFIISAI